MSTTMSRWVGQLGVEDAYRDLAKRAMQSPVVTQLITTGNFTFGVDIPDILRDSPQLRKTAMQLADRYPIFESRMSRRYGADWRDQAAVPRIETPLTVKLGQRLGVSPLMSIPVRVYRENAQLPRSATPDMRREFMTYGQTIDDQRPLDKCAEVIRVETNMRLEHPGRIGVYTVYDTKGTRHEMVIVPRMNYESDSCVPCSPYSTQSDGIPLVAIATDGSGMFAAPAGALLVEQQADEDPEVDYKDWVEGLSDADSMVEGKAYAIVDLAGRLVGPFYVASKTETDFSVDTLSIPVATSTAGDTGYSGYFSTVVIEPDLREPSIRRGILRVPDTAKVIEIALAEKANDGPEDCCGGRSTSRTIEAPFKPAPLEHRLGASLTKADRKRLDKQLNTFPWKPANKKALDRLSANPDLEISKHAGRFCINRAFYDWAEAQRHLVYQCGLHAKQASQLLEQAAPLVVAKYIYKQAGPELLPTQAIFPSVPEGPSGSIGALGGMVPVGLDQPVSGQATIPATMAPPPTDPTVEFRDPGNPTGNPSLSPEMQAEMQGSPDGLFETSAIQALLKNNRIDGIMQRVASELLQCTNALGDLLLVFYANPQAFTGRFGRQELEALEEAIITNFENNGDLYAKLKQPEASTDTMSLTGLPGEAMAETVI